MSRDGIAGLVVLVLSLALYGLTFRIQANSLVPVSPAFYPRMVLGASAVLSFVLLASDLLAQRARRSTPQPATPATPRLRYGMVAIMFAIFALYVVALPYAGFRVATCGFLAVMQWAMDRPRTLRGWIVLVLVAVITTAFTYLMFDTYLQVLLPRGTWTGF
jgi:putative tricarboxylic transport membrane protein